MLARTPRHRNVQRKKSHSENTPKRTIGISVDDAEQGCRKPKRVRQGGKHCRLCKQNGHQVQRCPLIVAFSGHWITQRQPDVSKSQRGALAASLSDLLVYTNWSRLLEQKQVYASLPKFGKDGALIIHRRVYVDKNHPQKDSATNYALECTVFLEGGDRSDEYDYILFSFSLYTVFLFVGGG
jgi:hypothetical protein